MNLRNASQQLRRGELVEGNPKGNSMSPKINSGDHVKIEPVEYFDTQIGDIVLAKVKSDWYLHLVVGIENKRRIIGNNHGRINGPTSQIVGRVVEVEGQEL